MQDHLVVLEPFHLQFPVPLALKVTEKLYFRRMSVVLRAPNTQAKESVEEKTENVKTLISTFAYWDQDIESFREKSGMSVEHPTFQPVFADISERVSDAGGLQTEEDQDAFAKLLSKRRALEKKNSDETCGEDENQDEDQRESERLDAHLEARGYGCRSSC